MHADTSEIHTYDTVKMWLAMSCLHRRKTVQSESKNMCDGRLCKATHLGVTT